MARKVSDSLEMSPETARVGSGPSFAS
ncbi:uncharacterized protein G2W53_021305 [Senna tora]|uniref:Uncharacterized protein n=1 Tax=Senna tora TaxID=362788 RepID=A0A834WKZ6_9FABA|nr:uncharacterized protein G2W53_021305 [Senna tora]